MSSRQPAFVPARELARELACHIEPVLRELLPSVPLALAFIGPGSDVLGLDTARSMDHDWGPRLSVVVPAIHRDVVQGRIAANLDVVLPARVLGFDTRYSKHPDGTLHADPRGSFHRLEVTSVDAIMKETLLIDDLAEMTDAVWLSTPMQSLVEITAGEVFVDDSGVLSKLRRFLGEYPDHIWRYQLASLWMRVDQVSPFIGRAGEVGDDIGSRAIAAGIARDLMRIGLLQSRSYAPYPKWLGTLFASTQIGQQGEPLLRQALAATDWQSREAGIVAAGLLLVDQLNDLDLIEPVVPEAKQFHSRPFTVLPSERIAVALQNSVTIAPPFVGGIDAISDSTDATRNPAFRLAVHAMYSHSV